jgi:pantoate--beta-alanine ligase
VKTVRTVRELRDTLGRWRNAGERIALVPTMGNLHDGHMSLVELAREHGERVAVSVFVNPTQFEPGADFDAYPRTPEQDERQLAAAGVDLLFAPAVDVMYPFGIENATRVRVPGLSDELCGAFRPGHFEGVTSVVLRLFTLVQPDVAVFGEKDYQQQVLIRRMVDDLHLTVKIVTAPTLREPDGLAYSSRNQYLTPDERRIAPGLHDVLAGVARELASGARDFAALEGRAMADLASKGFRPDYVAVRRAADLAVPGPGEGELVVLAAAWLGKARLIDNLRVRLP